MIGATSFLRQTELALINAPFEEDGWMRATAMVATATHSSTANLVGMGGPMLMPFNIFSGPERARLDRYFSNTSLWGSCNWRVGSTTVPMAIQHEPHYAAYRAGADTADYDDAVADLDIGFGCQSALMMDRYGFVGLAIMRGRREGPCTDQTLAAFRSLATTTERAIRMQLALDGEAAELMLGHFGSMSSATLLLDRHGNLAAMTAAAEQLFERDGLFDLVGLSPRLRHRDECRLHDQLLARLLNEAGAQPMILQQSVGRDAAYPGGRWKMLLLRLPAREHGLGFDPHVALTVKYLPGASGDAPIGAAQGK